MATKPVATVTIPMRVPTGFHTLFVPQSELDTQDHAIQAPVWDTPGHDSSGNGACGGGSGIGGESAETAAYRSTLLTGHA